MEFIDVTLLEKNIEELIPVFSLIEKEKGISQPSLNTLYYLYSHKDIKVRHHVIIIALGKIDDEHVKKSQLKQLERLFLIGLIDTDTRCDALEGLSYFDDDYLIYLYGGMLLSDRNELVRVQTAENLSYSESDAAIPFLEKSLKDKSPLVKKYCAYGLGILNSTNSIGKLTRLEKRSKNTQVKAACSGALFLLTSENIWLDKLLTALFDKEYYIPMNVILYLEDAIERGLITFDDVSDVVRKSLKKQHNRPARLRTEEFIERFSPAK